jgi:hypothetical protein
MAFEKRHPDYFELGNIRDDWISTSGELTACSRKDCNETGSD